METNGLIDPFVNRVASCWIAEPGDEGDESSHQVASTGWETMLEGLIQAGFMVERTWPLRTERPGRSVAVGTNALASSIVLVCRLRPREAAVVRHSNF